MKLKKNIKDRWLKALRSGQYDQCKEQLCQIDNEGNSSFCCLGVLTNITGGFYFANVEGADISAPNIEDGYPKGELLQEVFKKCEERDSMRIEEDDWDEVTVPYKGKHVGLAYLNDTENLSFKQIANLIERHL